MGPRSGTRASGLVKAATELGKARAGFGIAVAAIVAASVASAATSGGPTAQQVVGKLKQAGLPIGRYRIYTASTDPNKLLGRPGQYTSKVNFNDTRLGFKADYAVDGGGSVEVFANVQDAQRRYKFMVALAKSPLFAEYDYLQGVILLRLSHDLTPTQARQYLTALGGGKVTVRPTPKSKTRIVVVKAGAEPSKVLDAYGAVLKNISKQDAHDVSLAGNLVDTSRTIISSVTPIIPVIPAGATYYWGGSVPHKKGTKATRFEVSVKSADFSGTGAKLPLVSKVKLGSDGYNTLVTGRVTNTVGFTLSQIAPINAVFFDARGKVLAGANGFLDADLPRGRTAVFEVNAFNIIPRKRIGSVRVTMDAERVP
jgi:hypothetical protein